jgi:hypothetical protein
MMRNLRSALVAFALVFAGSAHAAFFDKVERIEFDSINSPDRWQYARLNLQNTQKQRVWAICTCLTFQLAPKYRQ